MMIRLIAASKPLPILLQGLQTYETCTRQVSKILVYPSPPKSSPPLDIVHVTLVEKEIGGCRKMSSTDGEVPVALDK
jgi:hypothetical protein